MRGLVEVIDQFLFLVLFVTNTEFALLGPEHDGLTVHAADHVEGSLRFTAQREFQQIFLDARLDGFAQGGLDFEEAVRRAQALDALMRSLVVVILNPEFDPLASALEAVELGAAEELLPDAFPEPFDLAQRHRMVGSALEVGHAILFQLGLETTGAAPRRLLARMPRVDLEARPDIGPPANFRVGTRGPRASRVEQITGCSLLAPSRKVHEFNELFPDGVFATHSGWNAALFAFASERKVESPSVPVARYAMPPTGADGSNCALSRLALFSPSSPEIIAWLAGTKRLDSGQRTGNSQMYGKTIRR